jgi:hypothetical protein
MADKTYLSKEINFNKAPIMWLVLKFIPEMVPLLIFMEL